MRYFIAALVLACTTIFPTWGAPAPFSVVIESGNYQFVDGGPEFIYMPLTIRVRDADDKPLSGISVSFDLPASGPGFAVPSSTSVSRVTDDQGLARLAGAIGNATDGFFNVFANTVPPVAHGATFLLSQSPESRTLCFLPVPSQPASVRLSVLPSPSATGAPVTFSITMVGALVSLLDGDRVLANLRPPGQVGGPLKYVTDSLEIGAHLLRARVLHQCGFLDSPPASVAHVVTSGILPDRNYTDLWWKQTESGWGLNITQHSSGQAFLVWYHYLTDGKPRWLAIPGGVWTSINRFSGVIYATTGPPFNAAFDPAKISIAPVGVASVTFEDASQAEFVYSIEGVTGIKKITRQPF
jgi:hypothetical protein